VVRRLVGYDRYESEVALAELSAIYALLRVWTNHWQPVIKLIGKERRGARVTKRYDRARSPNHPGGHPGRRGDAENRGNDPPPGVGKY
jgi:hypothetical protein